MNLEVIQYIIHMLTSLMKASDFKSNCIQTSPINCYQRLRALN